MNDKLTLESINYKSFFAKSILLIFFFGPSLINILHSFSKNTSSIIWDSLLILGVMLIMINIFIIFFQLIASIGWLYFNKEYIIFITPFVIFYSDKERKSIFLTPKEKSIHILIGFAFYIICFTNIYLFLHWLESLNEVHTFNVVKFDFLDSFYFTTVTSATVGFGDILPHSNFAKFFVTLQIWTTFLYVIIILSSLPTMLNKIGNRNQ